MPSGRSEWGSLGRLSGFILAHPATYPVADAASKSSDSFGLRIAGGEPLLEADATCATQTDLGNGDAMENDVELAVAAAAEPT